MRKNKLFQDDDLHEGGVFESYESKFEYLKTGGFYELMCVNESERASGIVAALQGGQVIWAYSIDGEKIGK